MFQERSRRHSLRLWIAGLGLAGITLVSGAWKMGWLPVELADANTGTVQEQREPEATDQDFTQTLPKPQLDVNVPDFLSLHDEPSAELASASASRRAEGTSEQVDTLPFEQLFEDQRIRQVQALADDQPPGSRPANVEAADPALLQRIDELIEQGQDIAAHREMSILYWKQPRLREALQTRIEKTAYSIFLAPQPHYLKPYEIQPGDQLRLIAMKYEVPWEYLAKLNRVDPKKIRPGQQLKVNRGPFSAVVDLNDFRLTVHSRGYYVHSYPVGIGKDGSTPIGRFRVQEKLTNPTYYGPDGVVVAADNPDNPLGEHWISIGNGYGIHGTIEPESVGKSESRGCVRMHAEAITEVFELLSVDSEVVIRR